MIEGMKKVSVIVPAYNVEQYVHRAIESVLEQTYPNVELVIVDDGSTDGTWDVICRYAQTNSQIVAKKIPNGGVSNARNIALEHATGEYCLFLDSDDWLEAQTVEYLMSMVGGNEESLICCDCYYAYLSDDGIVQKRQQDPAPWKKVGMEEALCNVGSDDYRLRSACYKMFDVYRIKKHAIRFDPQIKHGEDGLFVFDYLLHCEGLVHSTEPMWNILERPGSATTSPYNPSWLTAVKAAEKMMGRQCTSAKVAQALKEYRLERVKMVLRMAALSGSRPAEDIRYLQNYLKCCKADFLHSDQNVKSKIKNMVYAYCPMLILVRIIRRANEAKA